MAKRKPKYKRTVFWLSVYAKLRLGWSYRVELSRKDHWYRLIYPDNQGGSASYARAKDLMAYIDSKRSAAGSKK